MAAEKVLLFGGTCVVCSNSPLSVSSFSHFDYIGSPWNYRQGIGGDGSISIRNSSLMLQIIHMELDKGIYNL